MEKLRRPLNAQTGIAVLLLSVLLLFLTSPSEILGGQQAYADPPLKMSSMKAHAPSSDLRASNRAVAGTSRRFQLPSSRPHAVVSSRQTPSNAHMMLNNGRARPTPAGVLLSVAIAPLSFVALVLFFVWRRPRTTTPAEVWVMAAASAKTGVPTKEFIRYYDRESKRYDKLTEQVGWKVPAWVEGKVEFFNAGDSILDLGCADGLIGSVLQNLQGDMQFTGLDLSKQMVKKCLRNGYQAAFAADLSKGLPHHFLNGKMYDVVTAFGCLEFIKDHEGLMQDITKYLKPGGHFLASFEVERPELDNDILVMGVRKNIRTPETVRHMLEEAGFDVLHADLEECAYLWVDEIDDQRVPIPYLMVAARRQEE